ncbi:MAG: hypothetical protein QM784_11085 [Polyangiaceae bacterium]
MTCFSIFDRFRRGTASAVLLLWMTLLSFSWLRFHSRAIHETSPAVGRSKLTSRVALVVLDGLRRDRFESLFPRLRTRATENGTLCGVRCPELTFTATGIYTLGTGDLPTLSLLPSNFQARRTGVDSLPWVVERAGGRAVAFGESVWLDLFGAHLRAGVTERDHGPYAASVDSAREGFSNALLGRSCELCIWHDPKLDKLGHRFGIYGARYEEYARMLDSFWMTSSERLVVTLLSS